MTKKTTYKDAGVDLDSYQEAMRRLPRHLRSTHCPRVIHQDGGFAGLFQLDFAGPLFARQYQHPVLVSCTDGVGTKLKVAQYCNRHDTVGIDLVAMSVNDALCCGAEPLFFLDYVALAKDDPDFLEQIVAGISRGCRDAACALLGGETAIMPDIYQLGDYDLAGFCVGVVERDHVIDGKRIVVGDAILAIASSGLHSNGYSLARKVVFEGAGLKVDDYVPELNEALGDALLRPTLIYARPLRKAFAAVAETRAIHGVAHITGGGISENLERILPANVEARMGLSTWQPPPIFPWLARLGGIEPAEMLRVFNMGVGMLLVVDPLSLATIQDAITSEGFSAWQVGEITQGLGTVRLEEAVAWTSV